MAKSAPRAQGLLDKACNGGLQGACAAAVALSQGRPASVVQQAMDDVRRVRATGGVALGARCGKGEAAACYDLARLCEAHASTGARLLGNGDVLLYATRACDLGHAEGCRMQGSEVLRRRSDGESDASNTAAALKLWAKACAGGSGQGCYLLAQRGVHGGAWPSAFVSAR